MCDLIDLNSPDPRKIQAISKLASPLIPGPQTPVEKSKTVDFISTNNTENRLSTENNPFDKVFKETAEYLAKKNDPFESVLEKARAQSQDRDNFDQKNIRKSNSPSKIHNHNNKHCKEDFNFTPKRKRHSDTLRMNKTMEEPRLPLLQGILNKNFQLTQSKYQNNGQDNDNNFPNNDKMIHNSPKIIICPPSPNSSVLNQSAMNDTLSETGCGSTGNEEDTKKAEKPFPEIKIDGNPFKEGINFDSEIETELSKSFKHRRSLSQGNKILPFFEPLENHTETFRRRSKSIIDNLKVNDLLNKSRISSASSTSSYNNVDYANNGFMETGSSLTNSESLDISRISFTPKLSSIGSISSLCSTSSSFKNKAFIIDSQSLSSKLYCNNSSGKSSMNLSCISKSNGGGNFMIKTPITDLELRFEKLKIKSMNSFGALPLYSPNHKVENFLKSNQSESENARLSSYQDKNDKLIDTADDFNAENDEALNCSSDSVFVESNNVDQSVFKEAKLLARTFDELAHQSTSTSFSSGDDLLYSRPRWNFDILPVSDDEEVAVDNLIELPASPVQNKSETTCSSPKNKDVEENSGRKLTETKISDEIKDLEKEFIDHRQDINRNKVIAATLLLDLEKIVHRENNPEAITLLENLEKVLGVKYESNTQLLATCLEGTNNLSKSPKKFVFNKLVLNENIRDENSLEKSDEDNNDENFGNNLNLDNVNLDVNKSEKSLNVNNVSISVEENGVNLEEKITDNVSNSKLELANEEKNLFVEQNEALELITNLSKILSGPNNDSSPLSLLTNLRQVLNLATNQLNFENSQITKSEKNQESVSNEICTEINTSQRKKSVPIKGKLDTIKSGRKKSIDSSTKPKSNEAPRLTKRSMSFGSGQRNSTPIVAISKEKIKSDPKIFKKALSCDGVPKPDKLDKISNVIPGIGRSRASSISGTGKYKLKKKSESENVVSGKKGPLKALLPVGNMQRRGSMSTKVAQISLSRTPPKSSSAVPSNSQSVVSSTPEPTVSLIVSKKSPKTKPVAASTPDGGASKARKMRLQFAKNNTKPKFSWNISPVTPVPTHSITGSVNSKSLTKNHRHNKTLSPPKRRSSGEALALNTTESSIPKYSPMAGFSRRNSRDSVKNLENSGSPKTSMNKSQTPKKSTFVHNKSESPVPQSPLKTMNSQNSKFKPFNLISKLRRGSNGSNVSDKENCS